MTSLGPRVRFVQSGVVLARRFPLLVLVLALAASACGPFSRAEPAATPTPPTAPPATSAFVPTTAPPTTAPPTSDAFTTAPSAEPTATHRRSPRPPPSPAEPSPEPPPPSPAAPDLSAYGGLGTWVDIYDNSDVFGPQAFGDPSRSVAVMRQKGVRTVFLEAGSYRHPPVEFPDATAAFIRAAHAAGIKVVAWYLPLFRNVRHDFDTIIDRKSVV